MPQPRRSQKERTAETRQKLIDATIVALLELGGAGVTVNEICRRAEVTSGAIQHHFGSKNSLMNAVIAQLFRPFTSETDADGSRGLPFEQRVARLVDLFWTIYGDPTYFAVLEVLLASRHDAELMQMTAAFRQRRLEVLRAYLVDEFDDVALDPETLLRVAHRMIDFLRGASIRRIYESGPALDAEILDEARRMIDREFRPHLRKAKRTR